MSFPVRWPSDVGRSPFFSDVVHCRRATNSQVCRTKTRPAAIPFQVRDRLLKTFAALLALRHMLFTPANAFPIASPIPDATGATTAVIAGVVHLFSVNSYKQDYRQLAKSVSSELDCFLSTTVLTSAAPPPAVATTIAS